MEIMTKKRMMLYSGTIHPTLAHEIADNLGIPVSEGEIRRFASGEIYFRAEESVRGADVFVVQTHYEPVNEAIVEQLIMIDAMKRANSAGGWGGVAAAWRAGDRVPSVPRSGCRPPSSRAPP